MRLYVVHDKDGQIAAAAVKPESDTEDFFARPYAVSPEHFEAEVDVADEHQQLGLEEICCRFDVDSAAPRLVARTEPRAVK